MIAKIAIDHRSLWPPAQPKLDDRALAKRLAETILDFGRVTLTGPKDVEEFARAARAQADALGYDFFGPLLRAINDGGPGVVQVTPPLSGSTGDHWAAGEMLELGRLVDLIVATAQEPRNPGLTGAQEQALYERDGFVTLSDALEVTLPGQIDQCRTISSLRHLREETVIPAWAERETVWKRRYAPLAEASTEVNVFDRFLFSGLKQWKRRGREWVNKGEREAPYLLWLLDSLDEHLPVGAVVNLYAFTGEEVAKRDGCARTQYTIDDIAHCLRALKKWDRPRLLNVFLANRLDHDRHIRFSCGHALMSSAGFDHYKFDSEGRLSQKFSYTYVHGRDSLNALAQVEEDARRVGTHWQLISKKKGFLEIG